MPHDEWLGRYARIQRLFVLRRAANEDRKALRILPESQAMTIDFKSLAVGLILGISIAFSIAAKTSDEGADGRFQITAPGSSTYYVIDTRTGKVWSHDKNSKLK